MKNLKKVLALVLAFACAFTMFAGAAFTDQADIPDVNAEAVDTLVALDVLEGYTDGSFRPDDTVTRAEMAKMIYVLRTGNSDASAYNDDATTFTDIGDHWARGYIKYCNSLGIIAGHSATRFAPDATVTTQEAAKMLLVTLGYNAERAGLVGAGWGNKTNALADENGLLKDVNNGTTQGLPRVYAAQLIFNAVNAPTVEWRDDAYYNKNLIGRENDTIGEKYMGLNTAEGVVTAVRYNSKGYAADIKTGENDKGDIIVKLNSMSFDPSEYVRKAVKALYKDVDEVYGMYADSEETLIDVTTSVGSLTDSDKVLKIDGVEYDLEVATVGAVPVVDAQGETISSQTKVSDLKVNDASEITFIDNNGDEEIDIAVVTPVEVGQVTYLSSKNITVKGSLTNAKLDDCEVYADAAKDDYVAVVKAAYVGNDKNVITKLDSVNGKVDATKTGEARVDGTWYDVATGLDVKIDDKGDFYIYNGYIVAVDTTGGSISDVAYLISSGETMDLDGNYQAKVMMGGETKIVAMSETDTVKKGAKDMFVTYEVDDGAYEFTKIVNSGAVLTDYTAVQVQRYEDKRIYDADSKGNDYLIDSDAVVYVKYNGDKYAILTGADVSNWGDKVKSFKDNTGTEGVNYTNSNSIVLYENSDAMKRVKCAFLDLGTAKMPTATTSYGIIVSDVVSASDNKFEFTLWTGEEKIEVVTEDTGFAKWQAVEYVKNSDDTYDIDAVKNTITNSNAGMAEGFALFSIMDYTDDVVRMANKAFAAQNYNITDDTQIIFVDLSADEIEDICVNGGSIQEAGSPDNGTNYYRNATFVLGDGQDLDLLIVAHNAEGAMSGPIA